MAQQSPDVLLCPLQRFRYIGKFKYTLRSAPHPAFCFEGDHCMLVTCPACACLPTQCPVQLHEPGALNFSLLHITALTHKYAQVD